jgi:hypothetical protein
MCTVCADGWARSSGLHCETCAGSDHAEFATWLTLILLALPLAYFALRWLKRRGSAAGSSTGNGAAAVAPGSVAHKLTSVQGSMRKLGKKLQEEGLTVSAYGREVTMRVGDSWWRTMTVQLKIIVSFMQVLSQIHTVYDIPYPESFVRFVQGMAFINLDLVDVMRVGCVARVDFYGKLVAVTLVPLFLSVLLYAAARYAADNKAVHNTCVKMFLLLTFVIFPSVSTTVLRAFPCHDFDDGSSLLKADYSIDCNASGRPGYVFYAVIMAIVYPIGIPVLYSVRLWKKRTLICPKLPGDERPWTNFCGIELFPPPTLSVADDVALLAVREAKLSDKSDKGDVMLRTSQFLFKEYEPRFWWFEVFECARRLMLTGGTVFFLDGSATQVAVGILVALVSIQVYASTEPFIHRKDDILAMTAQWGIFFTLFSGLLLKTKVPSDDGYDSALGGLLIFVNAMVIALAVATFIYEVFVSKDGSVTSPINGAHNAAGCADPAHRTASTTANPMITATTPSSDSKQLAAAARGGKKRDVYAATNPATQGSGDDSEQKPTVQL